MAIFNSFLYVYQRVFPGHLSFKTWVSPCLCEAGFLFMDWLGSISKACELEANWVSAP
jgi:hypothetical protein